jgi:hypothetical protein
MSSLGDVASIITAAAAVTAVVGGYVQFVLKRSVLPSAQFDVEFTPYVRGTVQLVGELALVFKNVGDNTLIVTGVRTRIAYRLSTDPEGYWNDLAEPDFRYRVYASAGTGTGSGISSSVPPMSSSTGMAHFSSGMSAPTGNTYPQAITDADYPDWVKLVQERTFIQPGVVQYYRKPVALPENTQLVHIWGAFDYHIQLGRVTRFLIRLLASPPKTLDWRYGIMNHTVRRTFYVPAALPPASDMASSHPEQSATPD